MAIGNFKKRLTVVVAPQLLLFFILFKFSIIRNPHN